MYPPPPHVTVALQGTWWVNGELLVTRILGAPGHQKSVIWAPDVVSLKIDVETHAYVVLAAGIWDLMCEDEVAAFVSKVCPRDASAVHSKTEGLLHKKYAQVDYLSAGSPPPPGLVLELEREGAPPSPPFSSDPPPRTVFHKLFRGKSNFVKGNDFWPCLVHKPLGLRPREVVGRPYTAGGGGSPPP